MEQSANDYFTGLLKKELICAMGCTEPAAAALAGAAARVELGLKPEQIRIRASRDIIKNAMHVGIPNSTLKGISAAVALGIAVGDPSESLSILANTSKSQEDEARAFLSGGMIKLDLAEAVPPIFIEVELEARGKTACARVEHEHHNVKIFKNGKKTASSTRAENNSPENSFLTLARIHEYSENIPLEEIAFLIKAAETNLSIAEHSMKTGYGIGVGPAMAAGENNNTLEYFFRKGSSLAAAASDARMAGCAMPVVINSGSGNQGITISVPVLVLARGLNAGDEETARSLCLAHLTALMITSRKDRLSALCGAFTASIGTAVGFIRLLKGSEEDMNNIVDNMVANLIGIICDGAKGSCAMKIYSCVQAAAMSTKIVLAGRSVSRAEGIVGENMDNNLTYIQRISHDGMAPLDRVVLDIMLEKGNRAVQG